MPSVQIPKNGFSKLERLVITCPCNERLNHRDIRHFIRFFPVLKSLEYDDNLGYWLNYIAKEFPHIKFAEGPKLRQIK